MQQILDFYNIIDNTNRFKEQEYIYYIQQVDIPNAIDVKFKVFSGELTININTVNIDAVLTDNYSIRIFVNSKEHTLQNNISGFSTIANHTLENSFGKLPYLIEVYIYKNDKSIGSKIIYRWNGDFELSNLVMQHTFVNNLHTYSMSYSSSNELLEADFVNSNSKWRVIADEIISNSILGTNINTVSIDNRLLKTITKSRYAHIQLNIDGVYKYNSDTIEIVENSYSIELDSMSIVVDNVVYQNIYFDNSHIGNDDVFVLIHNNQAILNGNNPLYSINTEIYNNQTIWVIATDRLSDIIVNGGIVDINDATMYSVKTSFSIYSNYLLDIRFMNQIEENEYKIILSNSNSIMRKELNKIDLNQEFSSSINYISGFEYNDNLFTTFLGNQFTIDDRYIEEHRKIGYLYYVVNQQSGQNELFVIDNNDIPIKVTLDMIANKKLINIDEEILNIFNSKDDYLVGSNIFDIDTDSSRISDIGDYIGLTNPSDTVTLTKNIDTMQYRVVNIQFTIKENNANIETIGSSFLVKTYFNNGYVYRYGFLKIDNNSFVIYDENLKSTISYVNQLTKNYNINTTALHSINKIEIIFNKTRVLLDNFIYTVKDLTI